MLVGLPALWLVSVLLGAAPSLGRADGAAMVDPPAVSLSPELEPAPPVAGVESDAPVVRPSGYLLPEPADEASEEPAYAGS